MDFHLTLSIIKKEKRWAEITHPVFPLLKNRLEPGQNYNFGRLPTQAKNPKHAV
jgi:hypothetical protein